MSGFWNCCCNGFDDSAKNRHEHDDVFQDTKDTLFADPIIEPSDADQPAASSYCASCPLCQKSFRPKGGNAFESVLKHIRSTKSEDGLHQVLARCFHSTQPSCIICGAKSITTVACLQHVLTATCRYQVIDKTQKLATEENNSPLPSGRREKYSGERQGTAEAGKCLYRAAKGNLIDDVRALVARSDHHDFVNVKLEDGYTPLMTAAEAGNTAVVVLLLQNGADPLLQNAYGQTALYLATIQSKAETVGALLLPLAMRQAQLDISVGGVNAFQAAKNLGHTEVESRIQKMIEELARTSHGPRTAENYSTPVSLGDESKQPAVKGTQKSCCSVM